MSQKYKVFLHERFVLLTDKWPKKLIDKSPYLSLQNPDKQSITDAYRVFVGNDKLKKLVLIDSDISALWETFKSNFKLVRAAGGLVENGEGEYLLIFRRGLWDLPKGKFEKKETTEQCAIREVMEECGIDNLTIQKKICTTYHIYKTNSEPCLKPSHWFHMKVEGKPRLIPQTEEDITEIKWVKKKDLKTYLSKCYPSIKVVFKRFLKG